MDSATQAGRQPIRLQASRVRQEIVVDKPARDGRHLHDGAGVLVELADPAHHDVLERCRKRFVVPPGRPGKDFDEEWIAVRTCQHGVHVHSLDRAAAKAFHLLGHLAPIELADVHALDSCVPP